MFIQTEPTPNPATMKFYPGRTVLRGGTADFPDRESAKRSPLAERLFRIEEVEGIFLGPDFITVTKSAEAEWQVLKPAVLGVIMEHFVAGQPILLEEEPEATEAAEEDSEATARIKELIDTRIRPAATQHGGDVTFKGYKDGVVLLDLKGPAASLKSGIENMLRHYVPDIAGVRDYRDAMPKPGLDTHEARTIQQLLDERINPAVAAHGGHISLVDVQDETVFIRLEGGCQGCGLADVTLKQGVAREIMALVPQVTEVLDVTDHAGGKNPYYQPGKSGASPF